MKLVRENNPKCNATNRCDNPGRYKLMVEDVGGWSLCTEHAKELCSLEMPKGPKFIVSQHRYPGVPYCRHGTKESVVFRVTTEVENIVAEMLCEDCALAIVRTLEARQ